jgi:hypothetical protein
MNLIRLLLDALPADALHLLELVLAVLDHIARS